MQNTIMIESRQIFFTIYQDHLSFILSLLQELLFHFYSLTVLHHPKDNNCEININSNGCGNRIPFRHL